MKLSANSDFWNELWSRVQVSAHKVSVFKTVSVAGKIISTYSWIRKQLA